MSLLSSIRYRTVDIDPDYHQWVSEHRRWGYWSHSTQYLEAYDGFFTYIYRKKRKTQTHGTHEPNSVNFALFSKTKAYNDALEDFVRERLHHSYKVENENDQFKFTHITFETLTAYKLYLKIRGIPRETVCVVDGKYYFYNANGELQ